MHEQAHCRDEAANHQLPIAVAFWITRIVSAEECSTFMQNLMQICCCICSVILKVVTTEYTRSLNGVYHPNWLVKLSFMPVHSSLMSFGCNVIKTILIRLTIAGPQNLIRKKLEFLWINQLVSPSCLFRKQKKMGHFPNHFMETQLPLYYTRQDSTRKLHTNIHNARQQQKASLSKTLGNVMH